MSVVNNIVGFIIIKIVATIYINNVESIYMNTNTIRLTIEMANILECSLRFYVYLN